MNDQWFVVINTEGNAVSYGTVVADPLPQGLTVRPLTDAETAIILSTTGHQWDAANQTVTAAP